MSTTFVSSDEHETAQGDLETPDVGARANAYHALARALDGPADWESNLADLLRSSFQGSGDVLEGLAAQVAARMDESLLDRQRRFWRSHLGRWLPRFADTMKGAAAHPYFDALAALFLAFSTAEQEVLGRGTAAD